MDLNKQEKINQQTEKPDGVSSEEIKKAVLIVRKAILNSPQCFWPDILKKNNSQVSTDALMAATSLMLRKKQIRIRECQFEHAWEYILIK